jgi:hypothetical protein
MAAVQPSVAEEYIAFTQQRVTETIRDVFKDLKHKQPMDQQLVDIARKLGQHAPDMNEMLFEDALGLLVRDFAAATMEKARSNVRLISKQENPGNELKKLDLFWKYRFYYERRCSYVPYSHERIDPGETDGHIMWLFDLHPDNDWIDADKRCQILTVQHITQHCPAALHQYSKFMEKGKCLSNIDKTNAFLQEMIKNDVHKATWERFVEAYGLTYPLIKRRRRK